MSKSTITKIIIVAIFIIIILGSFNSKSIANEITNDSTLKYKTSLTSSYGSSDRANIYTTDMSVPDTAKYLINKKRPYSYTDLNDEDNIQLTYDDHYILIYKGEDSITFVQVSSRSYVHRNGYNALYRPYNRNTIIFFDRSYMSGGYRSDKNRYSGGYYTRSKSVTNTTTSTNNSSKINTNSNSSSKIRTDSNSSSKIRTSSSSSKSSSSSSSKSIFGSKSSSSSIRSGSIGTRSSFGGGTSFGK